MAEEAHRDKEEEATEKRNEEAIMGNIAELERSIAQESLNLQVVTEEEGKEYWEDLSNENPGQSLVQDNPQNPSSTSSNILTGGHLPIVVMGLVPFTPSKQYDVACQEDVQFDSKTKSIVWRTEKTLKMGDQPLVTTVTERIVVKNVE